MDLYDDEGNKTAPQIKYLKDGKVHAHVKRKKKGKLHGECPLCGEFKQIIHSHINPESTWINKKKYIDTEEELQSGEAFYLLCQDCDGWMGTYESYLTRASKDQITEFMVTLYAEKISLALLAILWRASIVQRIWKQIPSTWDLETEEWAKNLILQCRRLADEGVDRPESFLSDHVRWSGLKFFTARPTENNPYGQQVVAQPETANDSRGFTFTAGIFWNLRKGKGRSGIKLRYWSDNLTGGNIRGIDMAKSDLKELQWLARMTPDNAPCPCGMIWTTDKAKELGHPPFFDCCKTGWLNEPIREFFWRDADRKLSLQVSDGQVLEPLGSMSWDVCSHENESVEATLQEFLNTTPLKPDQVATIEIIDESSKSHMFLVGSRFIYELSEDDGVPLD